MYFNNNNKNSPPNACLTFYSFQILKWLIYIYFQTRDNSPLHKLKWLRVVLDEGHTIRNPNAQQTKAVLDLNAQRRWILTGIYAVDSILQYIPGGGQLS